MLIISQKSLIPYIIVSMNHIIFIIKTVNDFSTKVRLSNKLAMVEIINSSGEEIISHLEQQTLPITSLVKLYAI